MTSIVVIYPSESDFYWHELQYKWKYWTLSITDFPRIYSDFINHLVGLELIYWPKKTTYCI